MSTMQTPLEFVFDTFCNETTSAVLRVFVGVGLYFMIMLLICHDVERNPGPSIFGLQSIHLYLIFFNVN
jgi:hypothetical protein